MGPPALLFLLLLLLSLGASVAPAAPPDLEEPEDYAECSDGYEWDPETEHCKDVDECAVGSPPPCRGSMKCLNHFGGYLCLPRSAALLSPGPGAWLWSSPFRGGFPISGGIPISGVPVSPSPSPPLQTWTSARGPPPCRPSQECINVRGGFECRCPPGYRHRDTECVDEDECQFRWCQHSCANSPGAFSCRCHPGFSLGPDGRSCLGQSPPSPAGTRPRPCRGSGGGEAPRTPPQAPGCPCAPRRDECSMGARCSQRCLNTFGSFRCRCRAGFALGPDGHRCLDVDECRGGVRCQHRCQNLPGGFSCVCPPGYTEEGGLCKDRDECSEGSHGCGGAQSCLNTFGGHLCVPRELCRGPYAPHPRNNGACVCAGGVPGCAPRPRWLLHRFLALPETPEAPTGIFQLRHPPVGDPQRLRLRGGPPGTFRLRALTNHSSLLELVRPLAGPRQLLLEVELLRPGPRPPPQAPPLGAEGPEPPAQRDRPPAPGTRPLPLGGAWLCSASICQWGPTHSKWGETAKSHWETPKNPLGHPKIPQDPPKSTGNPRNPPGPPKSPQDLPKIHWDPQKSTGTPKTPLGTPKNSTGTPPKSPGPPNPPWDPQKIHWDPPKPPRTPQLCPGTPEEPPGTPKTTTGTPSMGAKNKCSDQFGTAGN
ncbi:EGF-containing fibulin-like extracellular matrix protein 2 [Melospiza melodia melodia]|uniref:EGF-containing fibulin-like extracellular matrix protein 2 n=1 Tax=Melospiza melodia melodia TaxID=1914991 RepID=UPI002FD62D33